MFPVFLSGSKRFWKDGFPYGLAAHYSSVQSEVEALSSLSPFAKSIKKSQANLVVRSVC